MAEEKALLEVKNLKKSFFRHLYFNSPRSEIRAVDDVSFSIRQGETLGIVGESGCGKTTVGKMIVRLLEPDFGEILWDGTDISKLKEKKLAPIRRDIQMIFQDPRAALDPKLTFFETIDEALATHKICKSKIEAVSRIERLINLVGLNASQLQKYPMEFSGGQCQRICIAKALAVSPRLLVCDEPVSALDVSIQAQVINTIVELKDRLNLTYIFISHNLAVVKYLSDKIGVMYLGRIVEKGSADDIYKYHQHPYTQMLLDAVWEAKYTESSQVVEDESSSFDEIPSNFGGCSFCFRCRFAQKRCREERPELREVAPGHYVACHLV